MKTLSDAAFFRKFDLLLDAGNPGLKLQSWTFADTNWRRERHSFTGGEYSFVVEVFTILHETRPKWKLIVTKEYWWGADKTDVLKNQRWSRPAQGRRADMLAWFKKQDAGKA